MLFDSVDQKYKFLNSPLKHSSSLDPKWGRGCGFSKLFIQFHFKQGKEMTWLLRCQMSTENPWHEHCCAPSFPFPVTFLLHVYVRVHICGHTCMLEARGWCWVSTLIVLHLMSWSRFSHLNQEFTSSPWDPLSLPTHWDCSWLLWSSVLLYWMLRIRTPVLGLVWQAF